MAVNAVDVRMLVGAASTDDAALDEELETARILVDAYCAAEVAAGSMIPEGIMDDAYLLAAAELWSIRSAPNGVLNQQYATDEGMQAVPIRISGDPLRPVYPLLAAWVPPVSFA